MRWRRQPKEGGRGGRKLVSFSTRGDRRRRAQGRNLEICYSRIRSTRFSSIQGSARVQLPDGMMRSLRLANGTRIRGRPLAVDERSIPEEMSMDASGMDDGQSGEERAAPPTSPMFPVTGLAENDEAVARRALAHPAARSRSTATCTSTARSSSRPSCRSRARRRPRSAA